MADKGDPQRGINIQPEDVAAVADSQGAAPSADLNPVASEPMRRVAHERDLNPENVLDKEFVADKASLSEEAEEAEDLDDIKAHSSDSSDADKTRKDRVRLARVQSNATTASSAYSIPSTTTAEQHKGSRWKWLIGKKRTPPPVPKERIVSREADANWLSMATFQWINPLMVTGYQRPLEYNDLWLVNPERRAELLSSRMYESFHRRVDRGDKRPLLGAMHETFKRDFWIGGACQFTTAILQVLNPFILRYLLTFAGEAYEAHVTNTPGPPIGKGVGIVFAIVIIQIIQNACQNQMMFRGMSVGGQARAAMISLIFDKSLRISARARAGGKAVEDPSYKPPTAEETASPEQKRKFMHFWSKKQQDPKQDPKQKAKEEAAKSSDVSGDGQGYSNGRIVNLMSVDAYRIDQASGMFHLSWTAPISLLLTLVLLLINLKEAALAGYALLVIAMPILIKAIGSLIKRRRAINKITDQRVSLTQEVLWAVRFVKYFGWETSFLQRLANLRSQEVGAIQVILAIRNAINAVSVSIPVFASMLAFITFYYSSNDFNPALIFSSLALFNSVRAPLNMLPLVLGQVSDAVSSVGRIQEFFLCEEEEDQCEWVPDAKHAIEVSGASFTWERTPSKGEDETTDASKNASEMKKAAKQAKQAKKEAKRNADPEKTPADEAAPKEDEQQRIFTLNNLDFTVGRDELVAVIGSVGSGKTSLLSALAGDMRKTDGTVKLGSTRAYCPQSAWIQNNTLRNNVLFGKEYERRWYNEVIDACALRPDLDILPNGDMTEIGEKGITVSGGQKQRLNIARAIYFDADIVLMDDPLSAVDAHVGRHIMDQAICGLMANKCRILATHQLWVLNRCDRIIWMDEGRVQAIGTFDDLMASNKAFVKLIATNAQEEKKEEEDEVNEDEREDEKKTQRKKKGKKQAALMQAEERAVASVPWSVYSAYVKASGSILVAPLVLILLIMAVGANVTTSLWLSWWTSNKWGYSTPTYIGVYAALGFSQSLLVFMFSLALTYFGTRASKVLLQRSIGRVLRAPMSFFDTTPLGRITNRFSKDIDTMDNNLTDNLRFFLFTMGTIISVLILIIAYYYYFVIALVPLIIFFIFAANFYRASAREVKRHESVLRSHVFARFSEAVTGVSTIRAYGIQDTFSKSIRDAIDDMDSAYFLTFANQRWLSSRLDLIGNALVFTVGILVVTSRVSINPSTGGLVLSYILSIVQMIQFTIRQLAEVENNMNATERIHYYSVSLEEEPPLHLPNPAVTEAWPQKGAIEFDNVEMRYRDGLPLVLKGLNLSVRGGERIGVVGRTGAGKSSIMTTLFRLVELSGGSIKIDGVDIAKVGLQDLRQRLAIIPQDPTLFRGTVRTNLDPFGRYSDHELWNALRDADLVGEHAKTSSEEEATSSSGVSTASESGNEEGDVQEKSGRSRITLDTLVEEEGSNFSLGQRQLMALARALVRGSRVIVCDEATSSVDMATDDRIQRTMATGFKGKTLLCIAHRLRTILNYDRVIVMDQGAIAECDAPLALYDAGGIFRGMCDRSKIRREDVVEMAAKDVVLKEE